MTEPIPPKLSEAKKMSEEKKLFQDYIADSKSITSTTALDLDLVKLLGGVADIGWITCDSGSILIQINSISTSKIPLSANDTQNFEKAERWFLRTIRITTTSSATLRYFFKRKGVTTLGA